MTTTATQSPSAAARRSPRGLLPASIALLATIAFLVVILVSGTFTSSSTSSGHPNGHSDTWSCRPTAVLHYC